MVQASLILSQANNEWNEPKKLDFQFYIVA